MNTDSASGYTQTDCWGQLLLISICYHYISFSRDQGSKREMNEEERLLRLFCVVPRTTTDQMLRDHFKQFGDIDYVSVVKDRETKESKGFAYVKFHK